MEERFNAMPYGVPGRGTAHDVLCVSNGTCGSRALSRRQPIDVLTECLLVLRLLFAWKA